MSAVWSLPNPLAGSEESLDSPMRILHVVPTYLPATRYGGTIAAVHGLCKGLAACGHDVQVVTTNVDGDGASDVPLGRPVVRDGVEIRYFPPGIGRRLYRSPAMGGALARLVPAVDLVHAHSVYLWPTWAAARCSAAASVPYVISPHGMLVADLIARKSRLAKQAWIRLVERRSLARACAVHVTSASEAAALEQLGLEIGALVEVPNGVDVPALPADVGEPPVWRGVPRGGRLLCLGRVNWKKGLERAILALADLPEAVLVVAGNDEEGLRPKLERLAAAAAVGSRVRFIGPVDDRAKWPILRGADLLVLPSLSENFGIVVLEALGVATPVVVSPAVGAAELVARHDVGLVVDNEPAALGAALRQLLADPGRRATMGERGAQLVRERHSWRAVASTAAEMYARLVAAHGSPRRLAPAAPPR